MRAILVIVMSWFFLAQETLAGEDPAAARTRLAREIAEMARETASATGRSQFDQRVMDAMARVPRHRFVPPELQSRAHENRPLPIGHSQTISQPFIVALMTDLAEVRPTHRVLEIGTGSGYQAAVLAEVAAQVYTIEIVAPLGERARGLLKELGYRNIEVRIGDGYAGWPEQAPFDAIVVTAAPEQVPPALVEQLRPGGRLVIPAGPAGSQQLLVIEKLADGTTRMTRRLPVAFVPLTRSR